MGEELNRLLEYGRVFATDPGFGKCFFPNSRGLFDMLGNEWETCWDQGINYNVEGLTIDPVGPVGDLFAMRGGSSSGGLFYLNGSYRMPNNASATPAFRVICGPLNSDDAKEDLALALSALNRFLGPYGKSVPQLWTRRGGLHAALGQYQEAAADFAKAIQMNSDDPQVWEERGRFHLKLGLSGKANADFRKAAELREKKAEAVRRSTQRTLEALLKKMTASIQEKPEDMEQRWKRGEWYAQHRRWKEAANDFKPVLERGTRDPAWRWMHAAPVLLAAGDREGYLRLRSVMRKYFTDLQDPMKAERAAKGSLLLPEAGKDTEWAGQLAERAVALGKEHPYAVYFIVCRGLADYRRGKAAAAVAILDPIESNTSFTPALNAVCHLVLAMAHHRRDNAKAASEHLARAAALLEKHLTDPTRFPLVTSVYDHDWLIAWLLHREAKALIEGDTGKAKK
jgi:tetratricopeptide (TPR) repeat protein